MAHTDRPTPAVPEEGTWLARLSQQQPTVSLALFVIAGLFALLAAWMFYRYKWDYGPVGFWAAFLALTAACGGLWLRLGDTADVGGISGMRLLVLMLGGFSGLATWLLSLSLAYLWRATILGGVEAWQGPNWWHLWVCALAMVVGLGVMFASLMLARSAERFNPLLRRLVYGYNAVLTGLLLLAILGVLNVLVYNYVTASFDWTESSIYTLSPRSENVLAALEKPTKIYVILAGESLYNREVQNLMENVRNVNEKVQVEYLSPDLDLDRVRELQRRYQFLMTDRGGLLVVYGTEPQVDHQFIKMDELFAPDPDAAPGQRERFLFKGEDALMTALSFLEEGKSRAVVYFLQGHGELDVKDIDASQPGQGAGALRERLQKSNYEVKGLQITQTAAVKGTDPLVTTATRVPDDASMVIVAGPKTVLPEFTLKALQAYMNPTGADAEKKKGKLVVLLEPVVDPATGKMLQTGLEPMLNEYNVQVGNDRILSVPGGMIRSPLNVVVLTNPRLRGNPVASAFAGRLFLFHDVRSVRGQSTPPPKPGTDRTTTEALLISPGLRGPFLSGQVLLESNLRIDPVQYMQDMLKDDRIDELGKRLSEEEIPVGVAVSEPQALPPSSDPHAFMRQPEQKPRLLVVGNASWVSNAYMAEGRSSSNFVLFNSMVSWLREKPANIGLEPKKRNVFVMNLSEDALSRMRWLPAMILFVGIIGLGTGVWLVRRR